MTIYGNPVICILNILACFEIRLPARSRFGEGRDFELRISDLK
jgi:hypothetical protein